jgi:hypothetical protein
MRRKVHMFPITTAQLNLNSRIANLQIKRIPSLQTLKGNALTCNPNDGFQRTPDILLVRHRGFSLISSANICLMTIAPR